MSRTPHWDAADEAIARALFRYGVIAEALDCPEDDPEGVTARVRQAAHQAHHFPGRGPITFSERTIWGWIAAWRRGGIQALTPRPRRDKGSRRAIADDVLQRAIELRREQPQRSTTTLLDILRLERELPLAPWRRSTLDRHLDRAGASRRRLRVLGTRRTIKQRRDAFGDLWVGDYHHGPLVRAPDGRVVTAKIGALLDHCTRYPVADRYYLSEDLGTLRDTLLRALLRWGPPKVVYVDRGSVYRSHELKYALLSVDCKLVHSRAYYSQGRGLIERWWQVVEPFEEEVRGRDQLLTLHELNTLWEAYREHRYCQAVHGDLGRTPAEAVCEVTPKPFDPEAARLLMLCRQKRQVHIKDGCVRLEGQAFLCDSFLRGREVTVVYDPRDLRSVDIELDGRRVQTATPQPINAPPEPHEDATPQRPAQSVDYLGLLRQEFDRKLVEQARPLAYASLQLDEHFDEDRFVQVLCQLAGVAPPKGERQELAAFWSSYGPLPEDLCRIGIEHAVRLHGRGRHVRVYLHAVRTLVLSHWRGGPSNPGGPR